MTRVVRCLCHQSWQRRKDEAVCRCGMQRSSEMPANNFTDLAALVDRLMTSHGHSHQMALELIRAEPRDPDNLRLADAVAVPTPDLAEDWKLWTYTLSNDGSGQQCTINEVPNSTVELWEAVEPHLVAAASKARFNDLLFARGAGNRGERARAATDAYLEDASAAPAPTLDSARMLRRALHLARTVGDRERQAAVESAMIQAANESLDDPSKPGVTFRLLKPVARSKEHAIDTILMRCREVFAGPWHAETAIELQRGRASDNESRRALDRELVINWMEAADHAEPLNAIVHRQHAERIARDRGLNDLVDAIVTVMQTAGPPPMQRIEVEVPEGAAERAATLARSIVGSDWPETVRRVLSNGPPSGDFGRNRELALDLQQESPLAALFPTVRLGGDGMPRFTATTEEERLDDQIVQVEVMHTSNLGGIFTVALVEAAERFVPTAAEIADSCGGGPTADSLGRAVARFAAGDYEAAAFTALPLIERIARELLLRVDAPIYRLQRQKKPGTYAGLGVLLPHLAERGLDQSWHRFLRSFATAPNGTNFRNEAFHGFAEDVGPMGAALVLISVYYLLDVLAALDEQNATDGSDTETNAASAAQPPI